MYILQHTIRKTVKFLLANNLTLLVENNYILFIASVVSKLDKQIILEKYTETCLIEAHGGQMIKVIKLIEILIFFNFLSIYKFQLSYYMFIFQNGDRRRTSGGIFFNLIKEDKSIPNTAKKDLYGCNQNEEKQKKKKREKLQRRIKKEKLKKSLELEKKKGTYNYFTQ